MNRIILPLLLFVTSTCFAQTWVQQANIPSGRHHPITFALNGIGYAVTGTAPNNQRTNTVFSYDPSADTWGTLPTFPGAARSFGIGVTNNGVAYLGFGLSNTYLNDFWKFDPSDSSWTQLANCGCTGRRHPAMISIGGKIYVGLGDDATGDRNDWWEYQISSNTWRRITNLPGPGRHHPFMFNAGGEVFAGLGHSGQVIYRDWYKLDTLSGTWTAQSQFPGQARVAGTQFDANGYGYVLSGDGSNHSWMSTGEFWRYDPSLDSWTQLPAHLGRSRWAPGSFVINNEVYFFGGLDRLINAYPTNTWKYTLANPATAISESAEVLNLDVFPNPADREILWNVDLNSQLTQVILINALGQTVMNESANSGKLDVQDLNDGLYFVQFFRDAKLIKTSKVLIQH